MGGLLYRENIPHAGQPTRQREPTQGLAREIGQGLFIFPVNTAYLGNFSVTDFPLRSQLGTKIRICGKPNRLWSIANARLLCL